MIHAPQHAGFIGLREDRDSKRWVQPEEQTRQHDPPHDDFLFSFSHDGAEPIGRADSGVVRARA